MNDSRQYHLGDMVCATHRGRVIVGKVVDILPAGEFTHAMYRVDWEGFEEPVWEFGKALRPPEKC